MERVMLVLASPQPQPQPTPASPAPSPSQPSSASSPLPPPNPSPPSLPPSPDPKLPSHAQEGFSSLNQRASGQEISSSSPSPLHPFSSTALARFPSVNQRASGYRRSRLLPRTHSLPLPRPHLPRCYRVECPSPPPSKPASSKVSFTVESVNSYIAWDFSLSQGKVNLDVGFSVEYTDSLGQKTLILPYRRYESDQGNFCTVMAGNYRLLWDNSYSTFFRKVLRYKVDCIPPVTEPVNSASEVEE